MVDFVHLRVSSDFSLLQSTNCLEQLIKKAKELRMPALALTDFNNLYACLEFSRLCVANGIQPIIGAKLQISQDRIEGDLLFLVTNEQSYFTLIELIAKIDLNEKHLKLEDLWQFDLQDLICLTGGIDGFLYQLIKNGKKPLKFLQKLQKKLLKDHLFLEIQRCLKNEQFENEILKLAKHLNLPLAATNDVYFLQRENFAACDALWAMGQKSYIADEERKQLSPEKFLKSEAEMCELFADLSSSLKNTVSIAQMCHFWPENRQIEFPNFIENGQKVDENSFIKEKSAQGLQFCLQNFVLSRDVENYTAQDYFLAEKFEKFLQNQQLSVEIFADQKKFAELWQLFHVEQNDDKEKNLGKSEEKMFHVEQNNDGDNEKLEQGGETQKMFHVEQSEVAKIKKITQILQKYQQRLQYELEIIIKMGFSGYFLIVSDFIIWAKKNDIPVGPGRGSGAGSLVAWCLQIVDYDPIHFGLLFERFLNPERVSLPDFDIDFCQERRDEVIAYVAQRYGAEQVANIITFGTMQARGVMRDVGRVLQMPYSQVDKLCKLIPNSPTKPITLAEALQKDKKLQEERRNNETINKLFEISLQLEGLHRHTSTHAAGVVIGSKPIKELIPVQIEPKTGGTITQFAMKDAENSGLIKFDFLGLKTLTVLHQVVRLVKKNHGKKIDFRYLPLDDVKTFQMLSRGDNIGIFQLENSFMGSVLKELKPTHINDLIALVSLNRPGPMDNIPSYIARKNGTEKVLYDHPMLEEVLQETFGIIVYQEQVMKIAQIMGGYSLAQADILRRAMGKKIQSEMDKQRDIFVEGAIKNGVDQTTAQSIFELVNKFAGYGFNKSHATGYALISYYTAFLKANFILEFFVAAFNLELMDTDKCALFLADAKRCGVQILPPCINHSSWEFVVENGAIRYALSACKNIGISAAQVVLDEREKNGHYRDIFDFAGRLDSKTFNKKTLEAMIKVGAFDSLNDNRHQLFEAVDTLLQFSSSASKERESSQISLFSGASQDSLNPKLPEIEDWSEQDRIGFEFEIFGFFFGVHPLQNFTEALEKSGFIFANQIHQHKDSTVKMAVVVHDFAVRSTPKGKMAILKVSDASGQFRVTIYDEDWLQDKFLLVGAKLFVGAMIKSLEGGDLRLYVKQIECFDEKNIAEFKANGFAAKKNNLQWWKGDSEKKNPLNNNSTDRFSAADGNNFSAKDGNTSSENAKIYPSEQVLKSDLRCRKNDSEKKNMIDNHKSDRQFSTNRNNFANNGSGVMQKNSETTSNDSHASTSSGFRNVDLSADEESNLISDNSVNKDLKTKNNELKPDQPKIFKIFVDENTDLKKLRIVLQSKGKNRIFFEFIENGKVNCVEVKDRFDVEKDFEQIRRLGFKIEEFEY